ncbi:MAG: hypothetical protein ACM3PY_08745 [Omnitrophica WOR_2 bacterium]
MLSPVTHYLPLTAIRRVRLLPFPGRVVARKGQKVNPNDVVAEAKLAPEHLLLEVARGLGMPARRADRYIQRKAGDEVAEGDVIAGPVGLARRVVRAPKNGRVVVAGNGQVLLEVDSRPYELKAGVPGVVTELFPDRGVEIEANGSLIQGVWGNGLIDFGLLGVLSRSPQDVLTTDRLDVSHRGMVILGGHCEDSQVLNAAGEIPLRGLVLASIDSSLAQAAGKARYPILVIEGFGKIPMNPAAYKLLTTSERREVTVNAEAWDPYANTRPEMIIPLPAQGTLPLPPETDTFAPGQKVRVIGVPGQSILGTLASLRPGLALLQSGVRAPAADILLENGENGVYPLANLEVLE